MKQTCLFVALTAILFGACKKSEIETQPNPKTTKSISSLEDEPDEIMYDLMVETVAYGLLDLSTNPTFVQEVNSEVALQFDGDDNVLLKTLSDKLTGTIDLEEEMVNSLNAHDKSELVDYVHDAINGFTYYDKTLYPQIFIPYIEGKTLTGQPVICQNLNDDDELPGIALDGQSVSETSVDQATAETDLIWVISVNESVNNSGVLTSAPSQGTLGVTSDNTRVLHIDEIFITDKKEAWGNGRGEITYVGMHSQPGCGQQVMGGDGNAFCLMADADLSSWYLPTYCAGGRLQLANSAVHDYWRESNSEHIPLVYYEKDVRKKFERNEIIVTGCTNSKLYYTTKEEKYGNIYPQYSDFTGTYASPSRKDYHLSGAVIKYRGNYNY